MSIGTDHAIHPNVGGVGFLEWHQIDVAREAGRIATRRALPQIVELMQGEGGAATRGSRVHWGRR